MEEKQEEGAMSAETGRARAAALEVAVESFAPTRRPLQGWPRIAPVLCYGDSKAAVTWLERAFGFKNREKMIGVDGQVLHCGLMGNGTRYVFVDDLDAHYAPAKAAGAVIVTEPETSYGQRRYRALDLEGHEWCFSMEVQLS